MKYYAVIDTNVLASSLLSPHPDSATVLIRKHVAKGDLVPLFNAEIFAEYRSVLARPKLGLPESLVAAILDAINEAGLSLGRTASAESFPDPKDVVFYEVALSKEDAYLVTGNIKHFPKKPFVVTPAEMLAIIEKNK